MARAMTRVRLWSADRLAIARFDLAVVGLGLLAALVVTRNPSGAAPQIVVLVIVVGGWVALPRDYRFGTLIGLAVLAGLDALPGPDLTTNVVKFGLTEQDYVVLLLIVMLGLDNWRNSFGQIHRSRLGQFIILCSLLNITWWLYTLCRTSLDPRLVLTHSANFGSDFLFLALLMPLLPGTLRRANVRNPMLVVIGAWSVFEACVLILAAVGHGAGASLLHPTQTAPLSGITRVYAPAADLYSAVLPMSIAAALLASSRRLRLFAGIVASANLLALSLELTRARYVGCAVGLVVAMIFYMRGPRAGQALRRLMIVTGAIALLITGTVIFAPHSGIAHAVSSTSKRVASIGSATGNDPQTSTLAVRSSEASLLAQRLGDHNLLGLGFISPRDAWDPSLPFGSIRNSDVGLLNVTMTMGTIGAVLYYLPLVGIAVAMILRSVKALDEDLRWLGLGTLAVCVGMFATSVTLVTLFSPTGVVSVATIFGLGAFVALTPPPSDFSPRRIWVLPWWSRPHYRQALRRAGANWDKSHRRHR
jgi:hypothetical protein